MWKDIPGWGNRYEISTEGQIRNKETMTLLHPGTNPKGYKYVRLTYNGRTKLVFVHRLLAQAFIPNPDRLPEVNHKDLNKSNNSLDNLEWITGRDNDIHACINGARAYRPFAATFETGETKQYNAPRDLAEEVHATIKSVIHWLHGDSRGYRVYGIKEVFYIDDSRKSLTTIENQSESEG